MDAPKPYRPSNGTEGDAFYSRWCDDCEHHDAAGAPCAILISSHFKQPDEWIYINGTPTCTAFCGGPLLGPRCPFTMEMFE